MLNLEVLATVMLSPLRKGQTLCLHGAISDVVLEIRDLVFYGNIPIVDCSFFHSFQLYFIFNPRVGGVLRAPPHAQRSPDSVRMYYMHHMCMMHGSRLKAQVTQGIRLISIP